MRRWKYSFASLVGAVTLFFGTAEFASAGVYSLVINGSPVNGRLDPNDEKLSDNSYFDLYEFQGKAGQQITITMSSQNVDSFLILLDPEGKKLAENDDSDGSTNSQIAFILPVNGTYSILANTYEAESTGAYSLQATEAASRSVLATQKYFCNEDRNAPMTMARSRSGEVYPLIEWTDWSLNYSPLERCQQVSQRFNEVNSRFGRLRLTAGTWNHQPVVCAASNVTDANQGKCAANGLVLTAQNRDNAWSIVKRLQERFSDIAQGREVASRDDGIVPAGLPIELDIVVGEGDAPYVDIGEF